MSKKLVYRILVVEDDTAFANILTSRLSREGFLVYYAKDPEKGKEIAKNKDLDIVVTDLVMPRSNGFDLIRDLKMVNKTSKVDYIILSNHGEPRTVYDEKFLNSLGIKKYLIKSNYTPSEIAKEIKKVIISCKATQLRE